MAARPVVDGIERDLGSRVRVFRADVASPEGRKLARRVGLDLVPTFIAFDGQGMERWRAQRVPNRREVLKELRRLLD